MLSDAAKAQIRTYLGHADQFRLPETRLESVLNSISPEAEDQITAILANLVMVETAIANIDTSGVSKVDEIHFQDPISGVSVGFISAKAAGRYFAGRLSIILGTPIDADPWSGGGYGASDQIMLG